jgi:calcineurin-like phosphoesterase family protein
VDNANKISVTSAKSNKQFKVSIADNNNIESALHKTSENIFVISDVEGDFDKFIQILQQNHIINNELEWMYGKGHLVFLGDFFDRGNDVTAVLWLCYKLEQEAEQQAGKVHFILGNHEQMNLQGNIKYVDYKYQALAQKLKIPYKELYGKNSELGRWIRSKNSIEIINDLLFVHGGISPNFIKRKESVEKINQNIRLTLDTTITDLYTEDGKIKNTSLFPYIKMDSPLWYRGYFQDWADYKKATQSEVDAVCKYYEVNKIIVGHTIVDEIKTHYNGKVLGIDVQRNHDNKKQKPSALLIENNNFYAVDELGKKIPIK